MTSGKLFLVLSAAILAASGGCALPQTVKHKAELSLEGKILFVPLKDAENEYYDSPAGGAIADGAAMAVAAYSDTLTVVDYAKARGTVRSGIIDEAGVSWKAAGLAAGADYVVYGTIEHLSWKDKDLAAVDRCNFVVNYSVYDVKSDTRVCQVRKTGVYPVRLLGDWGISAYPLALDTLQTKAYLYIGRVIASTFFTYTTNRREEQSVTVTRN